MALYIVGTPIGNLKDITARAIETLSSADYIACEDTRHSLVLLNHLGIKKPLISYYKQKEQAGADRLMELLHQGLNVALISDAGMPCISDPGAVLVGRARDEGVEIVSVPSATAVTTAVALAGINSGFVFIGFLAEKNKQREEQIAPFATSPLPLIFYAGPHDVMGVTAYLYGRLGERKVYFVRELTKLYESVEVTTLSAGPGTEPRGEYVIIVDGAEKKNLNVELTAEEHLRQYLQDGMDKKTAVKQVAAERGVPKDEIYKLAIGLDAQEE